MIIDAREELIKLAKCKEYELNSQEFVKFLDESDELKDFRKEFKIPIMKNFPLADCSIVKPEDECVYLLGNSLGLPPKSSEEEMKRIYDKWASMGVEGFFLGNDHWIDWHDQQAAELMAPIVGAKHSECVIMNSTTINIHVLMVAFYQPTKTRYKILIEEGAFPSDYYAVESQIRLHDLDPKDALVTVKPRKNEDCLRTDDIISYIEEHGDSIAVVFLPGVLFCTSQLLDMEKITKVGHAKGCCVGFDLCHAAGAVTIKLHDWDVDFAVWCSYKYLNSGPGATASGFIHEKHANRQDLKRLDGWFAHRVETRMEMTNVMERSFGAPGFQASAPSIIGTGLIISSLKIFQRATMEKIVAKSHRMTCFMELLIDELFNKADSKQVYENGTVTNIKGVSENHASGYDSTMPKRVEIITPKAVNERGSHLAIKFSSKVANVSQELARIGIIVDTRRDLVVRAAAAPLYTTYSDIYRFVTALHEIVSKH